MDLPSLPALVIETLLNYLSDQDVLHCSMVSICWREALNKDWYWKILCLRRHEESMFHYLKNKKCQVEPGFTVPCEEGSLLSDLCEWKVNYLRARHLERNREQGRYKVQEIQSLSWVFHLEFVVDGSAGNVLCLQGDDNILELWNVEGKPAILTTVKPVIMNPFGLGLDHVLCYLTMNGQTLVVLQSNILQVYKLSGTDYILNYTRHIDKLEEDLQNYKTTLLFNSIHKLNMRAKVFQHLFLGIYISNRQVLLCIWNLETGQRDKLVRMGDLPASPSLVGVHTSPKRNTKTIVVAFVYTSPEFSDFCSTILKYNLVSGEVCRLFNLTRVQYIINESLIVTYESGAIQKLHFCDISTDKLIKLKYIEFVNFSSISLHEPFFMFTTKSMVGTKINLNTTITHTTTLETLSVFSLDFAKYGHAMLEIVSDNILIVSCVKSLEVWDWVKQVKLYRLLKRGEHVYATNEYFTQMYAQKTNCALNVYNFW